MWGNCSNPWHFVRKATTVILNQLNIKKIKLTDNFEKNHNKKKYMGKYCSNSRYFKKKLQN